ncbi:winged helix-turn-helix transcriptional regulator [Peribacillus muralis]
MSSVTQKVLTSHLRESEQEGVIKRGTYPRVPPIVEYSTTECGKKLQTAGCFPFCPKAANRHQKEGMNFDT